AGRVCIRKVDQDGDARDVISRGEGVYACRDGILPGCWGAGDESQLHARRGIENAHIGIPRTTIGHSGRNLKRRRGNRRRGARGHVILRTQSPRTTQEERVQRLARSRRRLDFARRLRRAARREQSELILTIQLLRLEPEVVAELVHESNVVWRLSREIRSRDDEDSRAEESLRNDVRVRHGKLQKQSLETTKPPEGGFA